MAYQRSARAPRVYEALGADPTTMCSAMAGFPNLPAGTSCLSDDGNAITATGTGTFNGASVCNNAGAMQAWSTGCPPGAPLVAAAASGPLGLPSTILGLPATTALIVGGVALLLLMRKK